MMNGEGAPDDVVIRDMLAGDRCAFRRVVEWQLEPLDRYVRRIVGGGKRTDGAAADAADIVQEAFLKLWLNRHRYDPARASLKTWLYRLAHNLAIDHLRHRANETSLDEVAEVADDAAELSGYVSRERLERLNDLLWHLPERQRSAVALYHLQGFSNAETADILGVSVRALESLLARGRKTLNQMTEGESKP